MNDHAEYSILHDRLFEFRSKGGEASLQLSPFQKLESGKSIHANGGDADCPLCIWSEIESGQYEQKNAEQYPSRVCDNDEEGKAFGNDRSHSHIHNPCPVENQTDAENAHKKWNGVEEISQRLGGKREDQSAGGAEDTVGKQDVAEVELIVHRLLLKVR